MDIKFWEYLVYFFVTTFLLLVGFFLLLLGVLHAIPGLVKKSKGSARNYLITGFAFLGVIAGYLYYSYIREIDLGTREVSIVIKKGDDFASFAGRLQSEGVVASKLVFEYSARWQSVDKRLIPGEYKFTGLNSCQSVLEKLRKAEGVQAKVTIYEGAPIWKVAAVLAKQLGIDSARVLALNRDTVFLDSLGIPCLEGYLFPETYILPPGIDLRSVVREMVDMFHKRTDSLWTKQRPEGLTPQQALVLASIVQAETKFPSEVRTVAAVYCNRLRRGMTLDADPTVIYGLGGLDRPLTKEDLDIMTPYNTYRAAGLPPTPINSPGLPAIMAAINPDTSAFLYFVADGQGGHRFSYTNDEQNTTRKQIKLERRRN